MRSLLALLLVVSMPLVACDQGGIDAPTATPDRSPGATRTPTSASPNATAEPGYDFPDSTRCERPEGYSVSYPASWFTSSGDVVPECGQFSPEEFEVARGDERVAPITIFIDPVEFFRAANPDSEFSTEIGRASTVIDGRRAVRVEQESTGKGFYADGTRQSLYIIDLGGAPVAPSRAQCSSIPSTSVILITQPT